MKKILILLIVIGGCSPKIVVNNYKESNPYSKTEIYESFALLEIGDFQSLNKEEVIADIEIKDSGFSLNCDYETVKNLAEEQARTMGGNCLIITEHKHPDMKSTCHRIKAQVLRIKNPERHEKYILWHPKRPLKTSNFRGSPEKRPFQAATHSMIRYYASRSGANGKVTFVVESLFDCNLSYFKSSDRDSAVLAHEQLHFDITELYARKFRKAISEEVSNLKELLANHEDIYSNIIKELTVKQDEYDSEVYADRSLQEKWNKWVGLELKKFDKFSQRQVEF